MRFLIDFMRAPARYKPETAWGPLAGLIATTVVVLAPMLVLMVVMVVQEATGTMSVGADGFLQDMTRLNTPLGVLVMGVTQAVSLALVWWFAGRGGLRWPTLSLTSGQPSYLVCIALGTLIIVAIGIVEFVLFQLIKFDVFEDSKFLVEGLRSDMWPATLLVAVVLAPLWEELTFRGFLLSALAKSRLGIVGGGLVSNGLWTALHAGYSIPALLSVFVAGGVITWLVWKTGSLRIAIVTHALVNLSAAAFAVLFSPY